MTGKGDSLLRGVGRKSGRLCVQFARPWSRSSAGAGGQNGWDAAGACGVRDSSLLAGGRRIFCRRRKSFRCSCLGLLLAFWNPLLLALSCLAAVLLHLQILQEEAFLPAAFGPAYTRYRSRVCRYPGRRRPR